MKFTNIRLSKLLKKIITRKMQCSICQENVVEPVRLTCRASHSFCFGCILDYIENNKELKNCPSCRGGGKYILLPDKDSSEENSQGSTSNEVTFKSLKNFHNSLPILQKIKNIESNSCLISDDILYLYISNKDQIELINEIIKNRKENGIAVSESDTDKLIKLIRWKTSSGSLNDLAGDMIGQFVMDNIFGSSSGPREQPSDIPSVGTWTNAASSIPIIFDFMPPSRRNNSR